MGVSGFCPAQTDWLISAPLVLPAKVMNGSEGKHRAWSHCMFSQKTAGGTETLLRRCNMRTTETLPSLPPNENSGYSPEVQLLLTSPQSKEGKGAPELIQRISGKWQQEGEIVKQVNNCVLLSAGHCFPEKGTSLSSVGHPNKSNTKHFWSLPHSVN